MIKKIIATSVCIILTVGAASAMPVTRARPHTLMKPVTVAHRGVPVARPAVNTRPQMVVVHKQARHSHNKPCHSKCGGCHKHPNGGMLTAMTTGLVVGGVLYALAK